MPETTHLKTKLFSSLYVFMLLFGLPSCSHEEESGPQVDEDTRHLDSTYDSETQNGDGSDVDTVSDSPGLDTGSDAGSDPSSDSDVDSDSNVDSDTDDAGEVDATTLQGKVMAGYQGWFAAEGDGSGWGWRHWASSKPAPDNISFDMWPDLRECDDDELFETHFQYADGTNAGLYSAYTPKTVARHVKWMQDYGIDGVFVQRFIGEAVHRTEFRDRVLDNVRVASENYGRVFANMYDISGGNDDTLVEDIKNDWMHLVDDEGITESDRYLKHNGRPVLAIWGFGSSGRPGTPAQALELVAWLHEEAPERYRATVMGGVPRSWRTQDEWAQAFRSFDIVSPWSVGSYGDDDGADNHRAKHLEPDLEEAIVLGIDYLPVIFPGFSWYNLKGNDLNQIPRRGGRFFWRQAYNAVDAGCEMIYVAMFDEVDESTAIFKTTENQSQVPTTGTFLTLDADGEAVPSDWYLRLTGEATKMLRQEIPVSSAIPIEK